MNPSSITRAVTLALSLSGMAVLSFGEEAAAVWLTIKDHRFDPAEIRVPSGKPIRLQVKNADPTPEEFESKSLKVEKVIAGNGEATIPLKALKPGRYTFFGEYHERTAQGALVVE